MTEKPSLAGYEFSQTSTLANGQSIDTGFRDMATADKYQVSWIGSASGLTLEVQSKAINDDSALSNSFTYDGLFFNGSFPVRQRYMRFILKNNTGSEVTDVNLEIKTSFGSSDKLTVTPANIAVTDSTPTAINRSMALCQISSGNSIIDITDPIGFNFNPTDVIWFTVDTDTNNSEIDLRFSLNEYQRT